MKFIVGLHGKKSVGKDFIGQIMCLCLKELGFSVRKIAFADKIKEFCIEVLGLPRNQAYGSDKDKNTPTRYQWSKMPSFVQHKYPNKLGVMTVRDVLQVFGSEFIRDCWGTSVWTEAVFRKIENCQEKCYVLTDVRFEEELKAIKQAGGFNVFVDGPQRGEEITKKDTHQSEKGLDKFLFDFTINNDWSVTEQGLKDQIRTCLSTISTDRLSFLTSADKTT